MDKLTKDIYRVDLHIHTPSSKCYKGPKDENEYLHIVEAAVKKNINIIAITDHNSIDGYKKLIGIRDRLINDKCTLETISDSKEAKSKLKVINKSLGVFKSLLIIPGVEFEVNNGIHMLVLFNPKSSISEIEQFLQDGGFEPSNYGKESDVFSNWSLFDLYKESQKKDCIILDAHSDSNKGIFNTLTGTPRIHAFLDISLKGICYKSEKQKTIIEQIISQNRRKAPIAFLKSSDALSTDEIGQEISYLRLDEFTWDGIKKAFVNPTEHIFTNYPKTLSIIKQIGLHESCLFIKDFCLANFSIIFQNICSLANSSGGFVIIGAESSNSLFGIKEDALSLIPNFCEEMNNQIIGFTNFGITPYPLKDGMMIIIIHVYSDGNLYGVSGDNHTYCFKNNRVEILNTYEIQNILTRRLSERFSEKINHELEEIHNKTQAISTFAKSLPLLNTFTSRCDMLSSVVTKVTPIDSIKLTVEQVASLSDKYRSHENGLLRGNICYFEEPQKPRLADAFLRCSLPKYNIKGCSSPKAKAVIYIIPGGAVYYSDTIVDCYYNMPEPILCLSISESYNTKFLCAFLKSSLFLWYCLNRFDDFDIVPPYVFNSIHIPRIHNKNKAELDIIKEIEGYFDKIITAEKSYLKEYPSYAKDDRIKYTISHNKSVLEYYKKIDDALFALLNISEEDQQVIMHYLKANKIFIPE